MQASKEISFGKFRLDLVNECLWRGTQAISLRPKAFAVLKVLVESPGVLVTKQQVLDAVWPGTFVGDAVLKDNIRQLREALDDDAAAPTYIETSHRRGYRFIGKFSEVATAKKAVLKVQALAPNPATDAAPVSAAKRPVLGREPELDKMGELLQRAFSGERQVLFVTGEPGIGKTTLAQAFLEQTAQVPGVRVARGQCLEHYGVGEAYLPMLDGFSRLCKSPAGREVVDVLREHAPSWLAQMPSLLSQSEREKLQSRAPSATREGMLREMAEAIETLTATSPLLLVLEDLHWCDYSTLELVSYLSRRRDPARLMVVGTYRPVDVILSEHPLKGVKRELQAHGLCHEIPLEYLAEEAVSQYLLTRFPDHQFPSRFRRTIYQRTEGNPLFMVNMVEYLIDQKMIAQQDGIWKLMTDVSQVDREIPGNLRQLIETKLDKLSPDERMVLEAASIAGMECSSLAIAAGLDKSLEWVEQHCEELARRHHFLLPAQLIELPDGSITPRQRFVHVLYREVPYRLMSPIRRSQIHQRIAERGVAIYGDRSGEIAAELAMHFEQSRDWARALEYLLKAAENAISRSAHHEASDLAHRGLEVLEFLPEGTDHAQQEMKLRLTLAVSVMATKGFASPEVPQVFAQRQDVFWNHGASPELFNMLGALNLHHQFTGDVQASLKISEQLLEIAEQLQDGALIMEAHRAMGPILLILGRCEEALKHLNTACELYATHGEHCHSVFVGLNCKVVCDCYAARALWALGYPDQALERTLSGLTLARDLKHPQSLVAANHFAAQLYHLRGEVSLVHERTQEALELAEEYGQELWLAYGKIEMGWVKAELGEREQGLDQIERALGAYKQTGAKLWSSYSLQLMADQLVKAGRIQDALAVINKALSYAEQSGKRYSLTELYRIKGEIYSLAELYRTKGEVLLKSVGTDLFEDEPSDSTLTLTLDKSLIDEARRCFAQSMAIAKQLGTKSWQLRTALSMDRLDMREGDWEHNQLAEVYSSFSEGFETADLKLAKAQLGATQPMNSASHVFSASVPGSAPLK